MVTGPAARVRHCAPARRRAPLPPAPAPRRKEGRSREWSGRTCDPQPARSTAGNPTSAGDTTAIKFGRRPEFIGKPCGSIGRRRLHGCTQNSHPEPPRNELPILLSQQKRTMPCLTHRALPTLPGDTEAGTFTASAIPMEVSDASRGIMLIASGALPATPVRSSSARLSKHANKQPWPNGNWCRPCQRMKPQKINKLRSL